jgi:hypothetical protein
MDFSVVGDEAAAAAIGGSAVRDGAAGLAVPLIAVMLSDSHGTRHPPLAPIADAISSASGHHLMPHPVTPPPTSR